MRISFIVLSTKNIASKPFKENAPALEPADHKFIFDVSTWWNSAYDILKTFPEMQEAELATLRSKEVVKTIHVSISDVELRLVGALPKVLRQQCCVASKNRTVWIMF